MRKIQQTRHDKPKYRHDIKYIAPAVSDKMPAYNASGLKEYVRVLPPVRNQLLIDTRLLADLINHKTACNTAELTNDGLKLNQINVKISEGIAEAAGTKFRFTDVWDFLRTLSQEKILIADMHDVRIIREYYFKADD